MHALRAHGRAIRAPVLKALYIPTTMTHGEYDLDFGRLHDAVLFEPGKIHSIVKDKPSVLEATNRTGENVLRWCALENRYEDVKLLRSLGSSIQEASLMEAIEMGNTDMLILLLDLGGQILPSCAAQSIELGKEFDSLSSRTAHICKTHLKSYGLNV